jgi:hypothetical protein
VLKNALYYLAVDNVNTMPPCESTLGHTNLAPCDWDEEHSSQSSPNGAVGCIINLMGSDSEREHDDGVEQRYQGNDLSRKIIVLS